MVGAGMPSVCAATKVYVPGLDGGVFDHQSLKQSLYNRKQPAE